MFYNYVEFEILFEEYGQCDRFKIDFRNWLKLWLAGWFRDFTDDKFYSRSNFKCPIHLILQNTWLLSYPRVYSMRNLHFSTTHLDPILMIMRIKQTQITGPKKWSHTEQEKVNI